jgi:hypothetical protein
VLERALFVALLDDVQARSRGIAIWFARDRARVWATSATMA